MTDEVHLGINGDSKGYQKAAKKAEKSTKALKSSMLSTAKLATASFLAIGAVITKQLIGAYAEQEQAEIRTRQTLESTGYAAGLTAEELFKMASALQEVTTFGDETIIAGQNLLLTFKGIGEDTFPRATEAMLDMATAMGTDLKGTAIQVGKALNDPATGLTMLTRVGITFTDEQKELIKSLHAGGDAAGAQAVILTELESQFGGAAKAAAEGTGSFTQVSNAMGDVAEVAGGALARALIKVSEGLNLTTVAKFWGNFIGGSDDSVKAAIVLKRELWALDAQIEDLTYSMVEHRDGWIYNHGGKHDYDIKEYAEATSKRTALVAKVAAAEKREYLGSAEYKKKISADAKVQAAIDSAAAIKLEKDKNAALVVLNEEFLESEQDKIDRTKEINDLNVEGNLEQIQSNIDREAEIKEQAKINELISKGEFEKATDAIDKRSLANKKKVLKQQLSDRAAFLNAAVTLANSENKALAVIGKAAALMQIAIATPPAVASSFRFGASVGGPVGGAIAAGIAATAMAAQAAQVSGIKGFSEGGIIPDGDDRVVGVRKREMVLTEQDQSSLLSMIRGEDGGASSGGSDININIDAGAFTDAFEIEIVKRDRENRTPITVRG